MDQTTLFSGHRISGGTIIRIPTKMFAQFREFSNLLCMTGKERDLLLSMLELAMKFRSQPDTGENTVGFSRAELLLWLKKEGQPLSEAMVKRRLTALHTRGVFDRIPGKNRKLPDTITLKGALELQQLEPFVKEYDDHRKHRRKLENAIARLVQPEFQNLTDDGMRVARSYMLWVDILPVCFRTSFRDPRKIIKRKVKIPDVGTVTVTTTCQTDGDMTTLEDERVIKALLSLVAHQIDTRFEEFREDIRAMEAAIEKDGKKVNGIAAATFIPNEFTLDICNLCRTLGLEPEGGNRDTVRDAIYRLAATEHKLEMSDDAWVKMREQQVNPDDPMFSKQRLSFLHELREAEEEVGASRIRKTRLFQFGISHSAYSGLLRHLTVDKSSLKAGQRFDVFIHNRDILRVNEGIIHRLYDWAAASVTRSDTAKIRQEAVTTLLDLWTKGGLLSDLPWRNARKRIIDSARRYKNNFPDIEFPKEWEEDAFNVFRVSGYFFSFSPLDKGDWEITATRDLTDPIIGAGSMHNKLVSVP